MEVDIDWATVRAELDAQGRAVAPGVLKPPECEALAQLYGTESAFRSRVVMARHGFGRGEYKYFAYPLPAGVAALRELLYPRLAPIANDWHARMNLATRFPATHAEYLARCH